MKYLKVLLMYLALGISYHFIVALYLMLLFVAVTVPFVVVGISFRCRVIAMFRYAGMVNEALVAFVLESLDYVNDFKRKSL